MILLGKSLSTVNGDDILKLIEDGIGESKTLDYKRELNLDPTKTKNSQELVSDITSFANTDGGVILIGIDEQRDAKNQATGIPKEVTGLKDVNLDKLTIQIEDRIRNYIEMPLNGYLIRPIEVGDKMVLAIGVLKRTGLPHMVTFEEVNLFFKRNSNGKYRLGYNEVLSEFRKGEERQNQIVNFCNERYSKGLPLVSAPPHYDIQGTFYLHIIPMARFGENTLNLASNSESDEIINNLTPLGSSIYHRKFNLEGFMISNQFKDGPNTKHSHVQVFRDFSVEYGCNMFVWRQSVNTPSHVFGDHVERHTLLGFSETMKYYLLKGVEPPYYVQISLRNVQGMELASEKHTKYFEETHHFSSPDIVLPPLVLYEVNKLSSKDFMPMFDLLHQSANYAKCPNVYPQLPKYVG